MVGLEFDQVGVGVRGGEGARILHRHDVVMASVENQGGLREIRRRREAQGIFDQPVMDAPHSLFAVMIDLERRGFAATCVGLLDFLLPARGKAESGGKENKLRDLRMARGVKGGKVAAHAGPDQACRLAGQRGFQHGKLAGDGQMLEVTLIHLWNFERKSALRDEGLEANPWM